MTIPIEAPEAPVVWASASAFSVRCPYCGEAHKHARRNLPIKGRARIGPVCGLRLSPTVRITGYWITVPPKEGRKA